MTREVRLSTRVWAHRFALLACLQGCASPSSGTTDAGRETGAADTSRTRDRASAPDHSADRGDADASGAGCDDCVGAYCSPELTACEKLADCYAIVECAGDKPARDRCLCAHPDGMAAYLDLVNCRALEPCSDCQPSCEDAGATATCGTPEAGTSSCDGGAVAESDAQDCATCVQMSCSQQKARCGVGSDCVAYELCVLACSPKGAGCQATCQTSHPEGYGMAQSLYDCEQSECRSSCAL